MMTIPFGKIRERWRQDPAYREAYEQVGPEIDLAFQIAEARHRAKLTQQQLATRLDTSQSVVARWESGRGRPSTRTLERIAVATGHRLKIELEPEGV